MTSRRDLRRAETGLACRMIVLYYVTGCGCTHPRETYEYKDYMRHLYRLLPSFAVCPST